MTVLDKLTCAAYGPSATIQMVKQAGEWVNCRETAKAVLRALRDSVDYSTPVTAQIVRAYVDGVLGEGKSLD